MKNPYSPSLELLQHPRDEKKLDFVLTSIINHLTGTTFPQGRLSAFTQRPSPHYSDNLTVLVFTSSPASNHNDPQ